MMKNSNIAFDLKFFCDNLLNKDKVNYFSHTSSTTLIIKYSY